MQHQTAVTATEGKKTRVAHGESLGDRSRLDVMELFESTVLELVQHMFEELVEDPTRLEYHYSISDQNTKDKNYRAEIIVHVPSKELGKVLGREMKIINAIKVLSFGVASKNGFYLVLGWNQIS